MNTPPNTPTPTQPLNPAPATPATPAAPTRPPRKMVKVPVATVNPTPPATTGVSEGSPPTPPKAPTKSDPATSPQPQQVKKGSPNLIWPLVVLIIGLAIAAALFLKPSGERQTAGNNPVNLVDPASVAQNAAEMGTPTVGGNIPANEVPTRVNLPKITQTVHFNHGGIIRRLGSEIRKDGGVFKLLYVDSNPASRKVFMQPIDRNIREVAANLSFDGFRPPAGELAVFDTVDDQVSGLKMNVYAWRLR